MCSVIMIYEHSDYQYQSFIVGKKRPVKFSTVADLSSDECERLLMKYIPPSIRKTKTSQLLFLRCVCVCVCVRACVRVCVCV